ncbi:MAG TPA: CDP-alcohol phosphatidyltransferase family protein [Thermoanaerobaculia bacterium]
MTWPNLLSALRMAIIPLFVIALVERQAMAAAVLFVLAGLTDLLDGFVARFWHQESALGAYLDPLADKLLLTVAFVMLAIPGLSPGLPIPTWITVLVITRDVCIVLVALVVYLALGISKFPPSRVSKCNTAFQIAAVAAVLATGLSRRVDPVATGLLYAVAALTVVSGLEYGHRFLFRGELNAASPDPGKDTP